MCFKIKKSTKETINMMVGIGMLILTGIIAYSAYIVIPNQIEKSAEGSGWQRFYYEEYFVWQNKEANYNDEEIANACKNLSIGSQKTLEQSHEKCVNTNKILPITVKKNENGECYIKSVGKC